jgi:hypothetical protein
LLDDVRKFVRDQSHAVTRCRRKATGTENYVITDGIRVRTDFRCRIGGRAIRVHAHL